MKLGHLRWLPLMVGLFLAASGCSDENGDAPPRPPIFGKPPYLIAQDALSDTPSPEFVAVRGRLTSSISKDRREYTQSFVIAGGRGAAVASDPTIHSARIKAASTLGIKLDQSKVTDVALANATLDQLLKALWERVPGAMSCADAGPKAEDCVIALLLLEVQRSEATTVLLDAGMDPLPDAGTTVDSAQPMPTGPAAAIECGPRDTTGAREVSGYVMDNETWSGKIWVKSNVYVRGGTLTIAPGTEIFMDVDTSISVGWNNTDVTLIAEGTAAAPIRFCGKNGDRGSWNNFTVESNVTSSSVLRNVLFADGGGGGNAALDLRADVLIDNVQVRNSEKAGVIAIDFKEGSSRLSVDNSAGPAVILADPSAITRFPLGGFLQNNAENVVRLRFSYVDVSTVFHNLGVPYLQEQNVYQRMGELTFEPGVEYRIQPDVGLNVAWSGGNAGIHANGTAEAPVVFRGVSDASANWTGINVDRNALTTSNLTHTQIRQAGVRNSFALQTAAPIKLEHVTLRGNANGLRIDAAGLAAGSTNLTITETQSHPIVAAPDALFTLPAVAALTGNMIDQVKIDGSYVDASGTIPDVGIPYLVTTNLYIRGANITLAPGTELLVGAGTRIYIGWSGAVVTFTANGTAAAPIRFTGVTATPGFWPSLIVEANVTPTSVFNYVEIGHGGAGGVAMLELRANVPVTNSRFFDSAGFGIQKKMANTIDYATGNSFENVSMGAINTVP